MIVNWTDCEKENMLDSNPVSNTSHIIANIMALPMLLITMHCDLNKFSILKPYISLQPLPPVHWPPVHIMHLKPLTTYLITQEGSLIHFRGRVCNIRHRLFFEMFICHLCSKTCETHLAAELWMPYSLLLFSRLFYIEKNPCI
jgi:hypothetical protein